MRISDWSSDVCSSDLRRGGGRDYLAGRGFGGGAAPLIEMAEGGDKFGAGIGVRKGARLAPRSRPAIEDMRADLLDLGEFRRPARQHIIGVIMRRHADARRELTRQRGARDLGRTAP